MRIGRLIDHPTAADGADYGRLALELVLDEANRAGGLHGEYLELVDGVAVGSSPNGTPVHDEAAKIIGASWLPAIAPPT